MPRTSSIGLRRRGDAVRERRPRSSSGARDERRRRGAGRAERRAQLARSRSTTSASEQTAITIAFRGPTFMNVCGAPLGATSTADDQLVRRERVPLRRRRGTRRAAARRAPRTLASSTSAPSTRSGGSASPAGEAVPRLPPIVPRLRICGEPTVRDASASAGSSSASGAAHRLGVGEPRAEPQRPVLARPAAQLGDLVQVEERLRPRAVEVELDHHVGAALDRHARRGARPSAAAPRRASAASGRPRREG